MLEVKKTNSKKILALLPKQGKKSFSSEDKEKIENIDSVFLVRLRPRKLEIFLKKAVNNSLISSIRKLLTE